MTHPPAHAQVGVLHGEMPKVARQSMLARFRSGKLRAMVVSDVVARGLDVPDCDAGECSPSLLGPPLPGKSVRKERPPTQS